MVSEQTGQSTRLHEIETSKRSQTQLIAALDLCDGQETELLLCYNRKLHYIITAEALLPYQLFHSPEICFLLFLSFFYHFFKLHCMLRVSHCSTNVS